MSDINVDAPTWTEPARWRRHDGHALHAALFGVSKRTFDLVISILLLPAVVLVGIVLLVCNRFANRGRLFFVQTRMGRDCRAFNAYKFRTMIPAERISRGPDDPLETDRITRFGAFLRKSRLDELPQVLNVLKGDMSLIGPRPDYFHHARRYLRSVPGYRTRHEIRPGISGLAQTQLGYAVGMDATAKKVQADMYYIRKAGFRLEAWIFWRTLVIIFSRQGC